jgi:hypothetical protein
MLLGVPLLGQTGIIQAPDFRQARWGMGQAQVLSTEGTPPSQVSQRGAESVVRYTSVRLAGMDCRAVYILAQDKLVRAKYVFQRAHEEKNEFLTDFTMVDAFLRGTLELPAEERVSWRDDAYKNAPEHYGVAVSLGHLQYATQWRGKRTIVTHALTGENGTLTHEIEFVSVDLEAWENQVTKEQDGSSPRAPKIVQTAAAP